MPIHRLQRTQTVHAPLSEAWDFFSDPRNLPQITPPEMDFLVVSDAPARIYPGLMIEYRVRVLPFFRASWLTEITHVKEGAFFVDEQRHGPYRIWHHEHHYRAIGPRETEMTDIITYQLPFGWPGNLAHPVLVAPRLRAIFGFRATAVARLFPAPKA